MSAQPVVTKRRIAQLVAALDSQPRPAPLPAASGACSRPARAAKRPSTAPTSPPAPSISAYRPWSLPDLLLRLHTFQPSTWLDKPAQIDPLIAALLGWCNTAADTLTCHACRAVLIIPADVDSTADPDLIQRFKQQLVDAHKESCLWRERACRPSLYAFPVKSRALYLADLRQRVLSLIGLSPRLPLLAVDLDKEDMSMLLTDLDIDALKADTPALAAITLAVHGWQARPSASAFTEEKQLLYCALCNRVIPAWDYLQSEPSSRGSLDGLEAFDPIEEHRSYCLWVREASPPATGAGWRFLLQTLCRSSAQDRPEANPFAEPPVTVTTPSQSASDALTFVRNVLAPASAKRPRTALLLR